MLDERFYLPILERPVRTTPTIFHMNRVECSDCGENSIAVNIRTLANQKKSIIVNRDSTGIDLANAVAEAFEVPCNTVSILIGGKYCLDSRLALSPIVELLQDPEQKSCDAIMIFTPPRNQVTHSIPELPTLSDDCEKVTISVQSLVGTTRDVVVDRENTAVDFVRAAAYAFFESFGMVDVFINGKYCLHPLYALQPIVSLLANDNSAHKETGQLILTLGGPNTPRRITMRYLDLNAQQRSKWDLRAIGERLLHTERRSHNASECPICFANKNCHVMNCQGLHHVCFECIAAMSNSGGEERKCPFCLDSFSAIL